MKKRILSGMRPTGPLHLGHMVGALNNWVKLQAEYDTFYMIADWHALMSEYENPKEIRDNSVQVAIDWISCGIDPKRSTIFVQSEVPTHLELNMILSCLTPLSWLERCPTYKEQLREVTTRDLTTYAFLGYPVLQAADIMVYKANVVPVGIDQAAHLELTREIARRFNGFYGEVFPEPATLLTESPKLLGLDNRKMSKSYGNFISLTDSEQDVMKKVMTMFTDPTRIHKTDKGHTEQCAVFAYFKVFLPEEKIKIMSECENAKVGCMECKKRLASVLTSVLKPIQEKRKEITKDKSAIFKILKEGKEKALSVTTQTMMEVKEKVGLYLS